MVKICEPPRPRQGYASTDSVSRNHKARKIAELIQASTRPYQTRFLEVGTGSGVIAHHFGTAGAMAWDVDAVDVEDSRLVTQGFRFTKVDGVKLPFPDESFDVVVSNHVIEHVGDEEQQVQHLQELARVMRSGAIGYLAVPSRWMLIEPHYKLPFLSWLPLGLASKYVRWAGRGEYYDCRPLTVGLVESKLSKVGFSFRQHHGDALRLTYELERRNSALYRWLLKPLPDAVYGVLRRVFPTLIYTLTFTRGGERQKELGGYSERSSPQ